MSFNKLSNEHQRTFASNCVARRRSHELWLFKKKIEPRKRLLIVGDRPGPKAPQVSDFHHTPFYAKVYSGGWLNAELVKAGISEEPLMWINSASFDGVPTDPLILKAHEWDDCLALGKNAVAWLSKNGAAYTAFEHPQYHKRFKSTEPYPFIEYLRVWQAASKTQVSVLA